MNNWVCWWKELVKQLKMKQKNNKVKFLGMLLGALGESIFRNMFAGKPKTPGQGVIRAV